MMDVLHDQSLSTRQSGSRSFKLLFLAIFFGLIMFVTRSTPPAERWSSDYQAARTEAIDSHKPLLVAFYMRGCAWCDAMETDVLSQPEVRSELAGFVPVRVDVERERALANRLSVLGTPTFAILDPDGKLLEKCEGYQPVEAFVDFLKRVHPTGGS